MHGEYNVKSALDSISSDGLASTTIITRYELLKGTKIKEEEDDVVSMLESMKVYQLDDETVKASSLIFKELKKNGKLIPEPDILIAGVAIAKGETLVSRDDHFNSVPGLKFILI